MVIGAGPGGVGTAALLSAQGLDVLLVERADRIAAKWRSGYDRLRINTSSWFSYLPGQRFPREHGRWLTRDQLVAYYDEYARSHGVQIRTGVEARRVSSAAGGWTVETSAGALGGRFVVVATGKQCLPVIPDWPGRDGFQGELIHSSSYRNADPYRERRALVVGTGNSGMDIALDLVDGGAAKVWLAARRPPHIMRREIAGLPHDLFGVCARRAPRRLVDANAKLLRRLTVGDAAELGLPIPADGTISRFEEEGRVPTIDGGDFVNTVRAGRIEVVPGVAELGQRDVSLAGGRRIDPELIVAATGYRSNLEPLVGDLGILDEAGLPRVHGAHTHPRAPGLHFVGYLDPRSGLLRELRLQAGAVAGAIRAELRRAPARGAGVVEAQAKNSSDRRVTSSGASSAMK